MRPPICPIAFASLVGLAAPSANAGDCTGDPGWFLDLPPAAAIGSEVNVCLTGPANETAFFMVSLGQGPVDSVYGTICLDFPLVLGFLLGLDEDGNACFAAEVPCEPGLIDLTLYAQFITGKPNRGVSNQASITFEDGLCAGDVVTWPQLSWDVECGEDNLGCDLEEQFDTVFPAGLKIGDQGGKENGFYSATFTSVAALRTFFPANDAEPASFDSDLVDPVDTIAGDFAGQLATARLNLVFDDLGQFDPRKNRDDVKLGDLVFVANVNPDLFGFTVREVLDICDKAISGELGIGDLDIDGDGDQDATMSDLSDALKALNQSNEGGTINRGTVALK